MLPKAVCPLALLLLLGAADVLQAQTTSGYPWLVTAVDRRTGRQINPIGCNSKTEAQDWANYLAHLDQPGYTNIKIIQNTKPSGGYIPAPNPPTTSPKPAPNPPAPFYSRWYWKATNGRSIVVRGPFNSQFAASQDMVILTYPQNRGWRVYAYPYGQR